MSNLTIVTTVGLSDDADRSHITDLALFEGGGQVRLFSTTRYDGLIASWNINGMTPQALDQLEFQGGLAPRRMGGLVQLDTGQMISGGVSNGGLRFYDIAGNGDISTGAGLAGSAGALGGLQDAVAITLANGNQAVYGARGGGDGLGHLTFNSSGGYLNGRVVQDTGATYAAAISDVAHIRTGGQDYIYSASTTEHGLTIWTVAANGILSAGPSLGMNEGLWIATPTALATARVDDKDYLIVGAAGSNSLSVIQVRNDGSLVVRDHMLDTLHTRFGGVQAVEVVTIAGQTYVISGGADDGITVHVLIPGGQLVAVDVMADTPATTLSNISDIAVRAAGGDIEIYVASASETGITKLRFDTGPTGVTLTAGNGSETLTGGAGRDLLIGGDGNDRIIGGAAMDIIRDGDGSDTMTGGNGADVFILAYDGVHDAITDFTPGEDRLDLSGWPMVRSKSQLTLLVTETGFRVTYGDEVLDVFSADGNPIDHRDLTDADLIGGARIPDVILPGFAGPYTPPPALPGIDEFAGITSNGLGNFTYQSVTISGQSFRNPNLGKINGRVTEGRKKRDVIEGSKKRDKLLGEGGNDKLIGKKASDRLFGGAGEDRLLGGGGDDMLAGGKKADRAFGSTGRDWISGAGGNDKLFGGKGDDLITGGAGRDRLEGGAQNDRLYAGGGNNNLFGQGGNDRLTAGSGADRMSGGGGRDVLLGGGGKDTLDGGAGRDRVFGGGHNDLIRGGADHDKLYGAGGNDRLFGGAGNDVLLGDAGHDSLYGGTGSDQLQAGGGNDLADGGSGADVIFGGEGADRLIGGTEADKISGGSHNDTISGGSHGDDLRGGSGDDRIWGGTGNDALIGDAGADLLGGEAGNDTLIGGSHNDTLLGGSGADRLTGGTGDDRMSGGMGNDTLTGNSGADRLNGEAGRDTLNGNDGNDTLLGGSGNDRLIGGTGDDILTGGSGADTFVFTQGADRITDITQGEDLITIAYDAFDGRLVASEILLLYGTHDAGTVTIDFENGNALVINGVTDYATFADSISVV